MVRSRILKIDVTDYNILDVMADPGYMPFFVRRFHIAQESSLAKKKQECGWSKVYRDNPKMLYDDCVDEIKRILGMQQSSASQLKMTRGMQDIVLNACSDWITEKTGRKPEFEIFPNTVKSAIIDFRNYGHCIEDHEKENHECGKTNPTLYMGDTGTPLVRTKSHKGDGTSCLCREEL